VPDPVASTADAELRAHVERVLSAQYELDREIGRGGMGVVYRAKDRRLKRHVAIKLLPPELAFRSEIRTRFLREAETAAQLSHPNIVPIYSVDERDGLVYFVMACVEGDNLAKRMFDRGPLPAEETCRVLREVGDALSYAHERGVVHRDIKPDNILLDAESGGRALVTDFGIARAILEGADSRLTATGMAIGTPAYMSPEQCAGDREVDGRTDLYALGVVAYQMLTGTLPFSAGSTPAMLMKHLGERPQPIRERRPDVPEALARVVMSLLEKDPANRFADANAMIAALDGGAVPAPGPGPATAPSSQGYAPYSSASYNTPPYAMSAYGTGAVQAAPSDDEMARWNAEPVLTFRRKLAPFIVVNAVIIFASIFLKTDLLFFSAIWSVFLAFKYAKLWSEGYDWRDVFKQPRDRLFFDVAAETIDDTRALFDRSKRAEMRERARFKRSPALFAPASPVGAYGAAPYGHVAPYPSPAPSLPPAQAAVVQRAASDRDEVLRLIDSMPPSERSGLLDVRASAVALYQKIESLAAATADLERNEDPNGLGSVETEIATLEAAANPLDRAASETRVRRLAQLKRQRRALADVAEQRRQRGSKLDTCRTALENMRFDLLRLRTGGQTQGQVTLMAERAMSLARDVDGVLEARAAVGRAAT
jgi:serine/threonine-protein kinase